MAGLNCTNTLWDDYLFLNKSVTVLAVDFEVSRYDWDDKAIAVLQNEARKPYSIEGPAMQLAQVRLAVMLRASTVLS